jgi:glycosyltransferase involved in cell wall biosynthesis
MGWDESKVHVCHNHLNEIAWGSDIVFKDVVKHDNKGNIIIGWQGSTTHEVDFKEALPALKRILDEYPNVKIRLFGDVPKSLRDAIHWSRFEWTGGVPYEQYPKKLVFCNFDIGIAPLTDSKFNQCKSNIKWLEYSAIKIPTVASDVYPYAKAIEQCSTGFLCKTEEEWYRSLKLLIDDKELRTQMGEEAHKVVWAKWSAAAHSSTWERVFTSLVPEKVSELPLSAPDSVFLESAGT